MNDKFFETIGEAASYEANRDAFANGILSLGELIALLRACDPLKPVLFSDGSIPGQFMSYRGYYEMLALCTGDVPVTVAEIVRRAEAAIGAVFEGYKGGEYTMHRGTPVWWTDSASSADGIAIVGVEESAVVVLVTRKIE